MPSVGIQGMDGRGSLLLGRGGYSVSAPGPPNTPLAGEQGEALLPLLVKEVVVPLSLL